MKKTRKLGNPPLFYVIAQVRFNPVHRIEPHFAEIQDAMRLQGFPDASQRVMHRVDLAVQSPTPGEAPPQVSIHSTPRFTFLDEEGTTGFLLDVDALTLQTTRYNRFVDFSGKLLAGLTMVQQQLALVYTSRIGARYLNAVVPKAENGLDAYLHSSVLGLAPRIDGTISHTISETFYATQEVKIRSRTTSQKGPLGFPPDIQEQPLKVDDRFASINGVHAVIDTDGFFDTRQRFDMQSIGLRLNAMHDAITIAFRATVTRKALGAWE